MMKSLFRMFLLSGGSARVVDDFELECHQCFANGRSPTRFTGSRYKQICQTRNNVVHYATYYDTHNRIPVYSAYKFEGIMGCKRRNNWFIEPQLDMKAGPNMASEGSVDIKLRGIHQALNGDYEGSGYDRGHLAPVYQAVSQSCADATFTLTNAAPQDPSFNQHPWRVLEAKIAKEMVKQCLPKKYTVYIVTGVVPGTKKVNKRVKVPSHFWTAFCCLDQNKKCQISGGFIGENKNILPEEKTVNDLEEKLTNFYKVKSFEVFDNSPKPLAKKHKIEKIKH